MSRTLIALWVTLISAIVAMSILATFWIQQRDQSARQRVREILLGQLEPFNDSITRVIDGYSIDLQKRLGECDVGDLPACVGISRAPLANAVIVVNSQAQLHYPSDIDRESTDRRSLIEEAQQLLREQLDPRPKGKSQADAVSQNQLLDNSSLNSRSFSQQSAVDLPVSGENFGWITWYHRRGLVVAFWWHQSSQWSALVVLPRARWMADILAELPDGSQGAKKTGRAPGDGSKLLSGSLKQLVDVEGNVIYQWGDAPRSQWEVLKSSEEPTAELPVANPLEGWRLRVYASEPLIQQLAGGNMRTPIWLAVAGMSLALWLGGLLVSVNLNRQLRQAASRVSFVNQVSHELRTPLTNICMYADLLAEKFELEEAEPLQLERIQVIRNESRRLNRLINNVLEFARSGPKPAQLRKLPCVLDSLVGEVLATFDPRFRELGFQLVTHLQTPEVRQLDAGAVEQILVNLIGNAEKYASSGKRLEISTKGTGSQVEILVQDDGPGIPRHMHQRVFAAFERVSDRLEDPAGTGIGLTIARDLARKHGGDCSLIATERGALFRCVLEAPINPKVG